jgi:uncharacterized protein YcnI
MVAERARPRHRRWAPLALSALLLVLPTSARAHIFPAPPFVEANTPTTVSFATPNERADHATTSLELTTPSGVELSALPPPPGWQADVTPQRVRWSGGSIVGTSTVSFPVTVTARTPAGPVTFSAVQGYDDGEAVRWPTRLTVLPATAADAPPQHLRRALVAGAIGLVVIGVSLLVLHRLRRGPLQNR